MNWLRDRFERRDEAAIRQLADEFRRRRGGIKIDLSGLNYVFADGEWRSTGGFDLLLS